MFLLSRLLSVSIYTTFVVTLTRLWASRACLATLNELGLEPIYSKDPIPFGAKKKPENLQYSTPLIYDTQDFHRNIIDEIVSSVDTNIGNENISHNSHSSTRERSIMEDPLQLIVPEGQVTKPFLIFELIFKGCNTTRSKTESVYDTDRLRRIVIRMPDRCSDRSVRDLIDRMGLEGTDLLVIDGCKESHLRDFLDHVKADDAPVRACLLRNFVWVGKVMTQKGFCQLESRVDEKPRWIMWVKDLEWKRLFCAWRSIRMNP